MHTGTPAKEQPQFTEENMKNLHLVAMLLVAVTGCAQNFRAQSQGSLPTTKNFAACHVSVRFTGQPEPLEGRLADNLSERFGAQPEGESWIYLSAIQGVGKGELALCVCPSEPIFTQLKIEMNSTSKYVEGIGSTYEAPSVELDGGAKILMKIAWGDSSASCLIAQAFITNAATTAARSAAEPFFSSLAALPKGPPKTAIFRNDGSATQKLQQLEESPTGKYTVERLKLLDQLLKEKLITHEEYNTRRAKIVDAL